MSGPVPIFAMVTLPNLCEGEIPYLISPRWDERARSSNRSVHGHEMARAVPKHGDGAEGRRCRLEKCVGR